MSAHLRYLSYVVRHKWFVFRAGLKVGAPLWRLVIHDWSKFTPGEWGPYVRNFYGPTEEEWSRRWVDKEMTFLRTSSGSLAIRPEEVVKSYWQEEKYRRAAAFDRAWLHHQKRNRHHWQYWVLMEDSPTPGKGRFAVTSPECLIDYALTDYSNDPSTIGEIWFTAPFDEPGQARLRHASRLVEAANRYRALPMPTPLIREMVADWMGAGRAITGRWEVREWYAKNREKMVLHPSTRAEVEALVAVA